MNLVSRHYTVIADGQSVEIGGLELSESYAINKARWLLDLPEDIAGMIFEVIEHCHNGRQKKASWIAVEKTIIAFEPSEAMVSEEAEDE